MSISNEKIATILEKCAAFIDATVQERQDQNQKQQLVVKAAAETQRKQMEKHAVDVQEVMSSVLGREIDIDSAKQIAESPLGVELLNKIASSNPDELGSVDGSNIKTSSTKGNHWDSFASGVQNIQ